MEKKNKTRKAAGKMLRCMAKSYPAQKNGNANETVKAQLLCLEYDASQKTGLAAVDLFCKFCWKMTAAEIEKVLTVLRRYTEVYPTALIPALVNGSFYYHPLLRLASEVLMSLPENIQCGVKIPDAGWTHYSGTWTPVCKGQYLAENGQKTGKTDVSSGKEHYYLPLHFADLQDFYALLDMVRVTDSQLLIYTP